MICPTAAAGNWTETVSVAAGAPGTTDVPALAGSGGAWGAGVAANGEVGVAPGVGVAATGEVGVAPGVNVVAKGEDGAAPGVGLAVTGATAEVAKGAGAVGTTGSDPCNLGFDVNIAGHAANQLLGYFVLTCHEIMLHFALLVDLKLNSPSWLSR
jgi:hypothetical protein